MKNATFFMTIMLVSFFLCCQPQEKEKREYCPTTQNAITVGDHNPNNGKIYIGVTHTYQAENKTVGRLYSDAGLLFKAFSLIKKEKVASLSLYAEGIPEGKVATLSNNLLQQIIPKCVIQYYGIKEAIGIDDREKGETLEQLESINLKAKKIFAECFYVEDNGHFDYRGQVKKPLTKENEEWLREVWYVQIVLENKKIEDKIKKKDKGIFPCGAYHAIRLKTIDSSVLLAITEEEYDEIYRQLIYDAFVCQYLGLPF